MRLLLTRPADDSEATAAELRRRGHDVLIEPMLAIQPLPDAPFEPAGAQAILLTSANGARALAGRAVPRTLPVFAVGDATARAAADAGFGRVESAGGDIADREDR
jgi:uroporphyrinogen-III synthase